MNGEAGYTDITLPQSSTARKVFDFKNTQNGLMGSPSGLPGGSSSRTMLGWFKFGEGYLTDGSSRIDGDPFGYGRHELNQDYFIDVWPTTAVADPNRKYSVNLDQHSIDEVINPIIETTATTWFHIVVTYDQASNTNAAYLNGQFLRSGTPSQVPATNINDTGSNPPSKFYIGQHGHTSDINSRNIAAYRGMVADVAIFNRVITANEVTTIYNNDNWYLNAGGGGDPHLVGFGGNLFTWQGSCDVVLITTPPTQGNKDDRLDIQIRTRRIRDWSVIDSVAIKAGKDIAEIESNEGKIFLNGSEVSVINTARISVEKAKSKRERMLYNLIVDNNKYVEVTANKRLDMIFLSLNGNFSKETKGILGSPENPGFFGRDGKAMKSDLNLFIEHWQVNDKDPQIFRTRRSPQYPEKCSYKTQRRKSKLSVRERRLKEKTVVSLEEAIAACAIHHPGPLKQFCIDDVVHTGDLDVVDDKFYG